MKFPEDLRLEKLNQKHHRAHFDCGNLLVNQWLKTKAFQNQEKHLSSTKVLVDQKQLIQGFYTLATGQADFADLPLEISKNLPRRVLPIVVLAWFAIEVSRQRTGLARMLLAQALKDCCIAGQTFAFVAVILDCINDDAKRFHLHWDFEELPGHPYRLFLSSRKLNKMMEG